MKTNKFNSTTVILTVVSYPCSSTTKYTSETARTTIRVKYSSPIFSETQLR